MSLFNFLYERERARLQRERAPRVRESTAPAQPAGQPCEIRESGGHALSVKGVSPAPRPAPQPQPAPVKPAPRPKVISESEHQAALDAIDRAFGLPVQAASPKQETGEHDRHTAALNRIDRHYHILRG